jgi:predicted nucleotidyltransferase
MSILRKNGMSQVLQSEQLQALLKGFFNKKASEYHLLALGYFGSYARNEATAESDVDIVFDTDAPNLFRTVLIKQDLEKLLGKKVDILQLRGLTNSRLRARIEREALYV